MSTVFDALRLCPSALLLRDKAYEEMREVASPFTKGLILIIVVGVLVSLVNIVGTTLEWATSPSPKDIKDVVWEGMMEMPWVEEIPPERRGEIIGAIRQRYERGWRLFPRLFGAPHPASAVLGVVVKPLALLIGWLIYGLLAHIFARLLGGGARLGQTFGCTALAVSPQLLNLANLLPYISVGGVVGVWTLICNYLALKNAHRLSWGRAFWATLLPFITLALLAIALAAAGALMASGFITKGGD